MPKSVSDKNLLFLGKPKSKTLVFDGCSSNLLLLYQSSNLGSSTFASSIRLDKVSLSRNAQLSSANK